MKYKVKCPMCKKIWAMCSAVPLRDMPKYKYCHRCEGKASYGDKVCKAVSGRDYSRE